MAQQTDYFAKTNKRLTAVNWLLENIQKVHKMDWDIVFAQAELMEKEQIMEAYGAGYNDGCAYMTDGITEFKDSEQYYNETYGRGILAEKEDRIGELKPKRTT